MNLVCVCMPLCVCKYIYTHTYIYTHNWKREIQARTRGEEREAIRIGVCLSVHEYVYREDPYLLSPSLFKEGICVLETAQGSDYAL